MKKVLLVIEMEDGENLFDVYNAKDMIVDIGFDWDNLRGYAFIRKKLLAANLLPEKIEILDSRMKIAMGWNECIDKILEGVEDE